MRDTWLFQLFRASFKPSFLRWNWFQQPQQRVGVVVYYGIIVQSVEAAPAVDSLYHVSIISVLSSTILQIASFKIVRATVLKDKEIMRRRMCKVDSVYAELTRLAATVII